MTLHDFTNAPSVLQRFVTELRNTETQQDRMRFRKNIERIGEILAYELSKTLEYDEETVATPLGKKTMQIQTDELVVCSILRAGLPLHQGVLNYFDAAENGFISAYRHHPNDDDDFEVIVKYWAAPSLEGKILVLCDPMLATGRTLENVLKAIEAYGKPKEIHIVSVIGSQDGISHVANTFPDETVLWIAAVDDNLNARGYIVPGLGDAGDLAYGEKM
ncbi:uracil phosphoribosyltransferase [Luteirhabdus pelagi]|uniref:uracil phosphoribosyltransferase n=1 Tax=Luteirhabdus pelagi TaxID=2792783 RepID=UPI00193A747C|nr:uracil phosphoribosyltransferase [Luteirhabdus pelagi]